MVKYIDCTWGRCKNLQRLNTIELWFYIETNNTFNIEYSFHKIDFKIWLEILEIHKEDIINSTLLNIDNEVVDIENIKNTEEYYIFKLTSKEFNLYRNISLILYLENGKWNNRDEMLRKNTWYNEGLI